MKCPVYHAVACLSGLVFSTGLVFAGTQEILKNGNFAQVLHGWQVNPVLIAQPPFVAAENAIDLAPWLGMSEFGQGVLVSQPVNVPLEAGDLLTVGLDVRRTSAFWPLDGRTAAVSLEMIDSDGQRQVERVLHVSNEELIDTAYGRFTATYTVPGDRVRLVGFSIENAGDGHLFVRNASLLAPRESGPLPQLAGVAPAAVAYGQTLTLNGSAFGTAPGRVLVGGCSDGVQIESWSDTQVRISLGDPSIGGTVVIEREGVRTWQSRFVRLTSPYFTLTLKPVSLMMGHGGGDAVETLPGRAADLAVFVRFFNGYAPPDGLHLSGSDAMILSGMAAGMSFHENPVRGAGGSILRVETAGWQPGLHTVSVTASDGHGRTRTAEAVVWVRDLATFAWNLQSGDPLDGAHFTSQGEVSIYAAGADAEDEPVWIYPFADAIEVTSSNPAVIEVYHEAGLFGGYSLLVHDSGSATITTVFPDSSSVPVNVSATIPASPRISGSGFTHPIMTNFPGEATEENRNTFFFSATDTFTQVSVGWNSDLAGGGFGGIGANRTWHFYAGETLHPGNYLVSGGGYVGGVLLRTSRILRVVNDPLTGLLHGQVADFTGGSHGHGTYGRIEFYDADTGELVYTDEVFGGDGFGGYTLSRIPPGSYKIFWAGDIWAEDSPTQWYPNADNFAAARVVEIAAGSGVEGIDFLFVPSPAPPSAPRITSVPVADRATGSFSISFEAEDNVEYALQKSLTMGDNTWVTVATTYAWGGEATLEDPTYTEEKAFYRVVRLP
ncbi:MAG: hypothetical protein JJT96_14070 [Opitutales bacterium]|nr:hypothetical protein [Opitutales bacterium]